MDTLSKKYTNVLMVAITYIGIWIEPMMTEIESIDNGSVAISEG